MNLLRQKIVQLEEDKQVRTALTVERDDAHLTIRKLEKKVERMQKELSTCRESNTELKAKLADTNELKASSPSVLLIALLLAFFFLNAKEGQPPSEHTRKREDESILLFSSILGKKCGNYLSQNIMSI
jgi:hypothetical protein